MLLMQKRRMYVFLWLNFYLFIYLFLMQPVGLEPTTLFSSLPLQVEGVPFELELIGFFL